MSIPVHGVKVGSACTRLTLPGTSTTLRSASQKREAISQPAPRPASQAPQHGRPLPRKGFQHRLKALESHDWAYPTLSLIAQENGRKQPSRDALRHCARILGIPSLRKLLAKRRLWKQAENIFHSELAAGHQVSDLWFVGKVLQLARQSGGAR